MKRILSAPFLSCRDLMAITDRYGWTYYQTSKLYKEMKAYYQKKAEEKKLILFDGYVPSSIAFEYLYLFGITKESINEDLQGK